MSENQHSSTPRRDFLKKTAGLAAATTVAAMAVPRVHAAEENTIQLALIGCGGRGSGAVGDAISAGGGPVKLVAMADVFEGRLSGSYNSLKNFGEKVDVPKERQFVGFDGNLAAFVSVTPMSAGVTDTYKTDLRGCGKPRRSMAIVDFRGLP